MDIFSQPSFLCPYCGSENYAALDVSEGTKQQFVQDCDTCCRPISLYIDCTNEDDVRIDAVPENE